MALEVFIMSYRNYDRDFKLSAVKMAESSDRPLVEIARSLGIHDSMLRRWSGGSYACPGFLVHKLYQLLTNHRCAAFA